MTGPAASTWTVVMPVKSLRAAKSRLELPPPDRRALALAMALDSVTAALAAPAVARLLVVTADEEVAAAVRSAGADVVGEPERPGLNRALLHGFATLGDGIPVAALAADLPALRPGELDAVLAHVGTVGVVADRAGTGTAMLAAVAGHLLTPRFGVDSWRRHVADGAVDLSAMAGAGLRADVDTLADLAVAAELGLGRHSAGPAAACLS